MMTILSKLKNKLIKNINKNVPITKMLVFLYGYTFAFVALTTNTSFQNAIFVCTNQWYIHNSLFLSVQNVFDRKS